VPWCYLAWLLKLSDILLGFSSTSILSIERTSSGIWLAWPLVRSSLWLQFTSVLGESSSYMEKKSAAFVLEATRYSSWDVTSSVLPSKPLVEELLHLHHWQINLWSLYRMPLFRLALLVISQINLGTHILVAGLSLQVASLFVFSVCCLEFLYRVQYQKAPPNPKYVDLYSSPRFKLFLIGKLELSPSPSTSSMTIQY
jgi:hypothetical protein